MEFEWDPQKASASFRKHGVAFEEAMEAFYDPLAVDDIDEPHSSNGERRFTLIGVSSIRLLIIAYTTKAGERIRIISARKTTSYETKIYDEANKRR
ncbi:BrnT family toxin [soil metagenome]